MNNETKEGKKRKSIIIVILALLVAMIAAGIGVAIYNTPSNRLSRQLDLGEKYLEEQNYEQAIVAFDEAIKIDPVNVDAYLGLADAYFRLGEYEDSLVCIDRLLELDSENTQMKTILRDCLGEYIKILAEEERYDEIKTLAEKYGSIQIQSVGDMWIYTDNGWDENDAFIPPQAALIDADGSIVFPYQYTFQRYRISDDIISLTDSSAYWLTEEYNIAENPPQYYHMDGRTAFELAPTTNEFENYEVGDAVYESVTEDSFWYGTPMIDDYALVINQIYRFYWSGGAGGGSYEYHSYIMDRSGDIVCTLPEEFNEDIAMGNLGFDTKYSLGWCGEGVFAIFENGYDEDWNYYSEAKGYMDFSGNMVLDLSGRGFNNLWPFHEGLAAVSTEDDMIGFINKSGELVIPCIYEDFSGGFSEDGICAVQKDGMWGYINRDNNVIIPFEYDGAYGAGAGLASVIKDGKCGLVDYKNRIVAELEYDDISSPDKGTAYAIKDRTLYIITVK